MKNVLNRATGEAMPSLTRRLFLRGAAVVAPLAVLPTVSALAAEAPDYVEENPALLALEPRADAAASAYKVAASEYRRTLEVGTALWPRAPRALKEEKLSHGNDIERDIRGAGYWNGEKYEHVTVTNVDCVRYQIANIKRRKNAAGTRKLLKQELAIAEAYEAECENARVVSGFPAASLARKQAIEELEAIVRLVRTEPARTMAGVAFKARVFSAWNAVPPLYRLGEIMESNLAADVAASLLDVLADQAA